MTIRSGWRVGLGVAAFVTYAILPSGAWAVEPAALRLFTEGRALLREGRVEQAAARFRESLAVEETIGADLNLGDCEERLGNRAAASRSFEAAAALAERTDPSRLPEARDRLRMLLPRIGFLTFRAKGPSPGEVTVDGQALPGATTRWAVAPGRHTVAAECGGGRDRVDVDVGAGTTSEVAICQGAAASATRRADTLLASNPSNASHPEPRSLLPTVGVAAVAVGGASAAAGIVFGLVTLSKKSRLSEECPLYPHCTTADFSGANETYSAASTSASVSTVLVLAGVALASAGGVLLVMTPKRRAALSTSAGRFAGLSVRWP
jgi:hypothetical protein